MPSILASCHARCRILTALALATLSCGCTQFCTPGPQSTKVASSGSLPVVPHGRYTLVEVQAADAQQDLMRQIVNVELPSRRDATLGDALHVILLGSGYRLCTGHDDMQDLAALPLPAVHNPLGPLTLRDALDVLGGPGWQVEVDESIREVCFGRRP